VTNTSLDGESSTGKLYLGGNTMILEYVVDVGGRVERNTDCWVFLKDAIARTGVIRQADRVIWFEAEMSHTGSGSTGDPLGTNQFGTSADST
jgi:hypothetical protein